jgi:acyl-CoA reductase-like NAD-dependent aldehyde dehydrogenase
MIGEVLAETDLPPGAFSILPCRRDGAELFTSDDRLKLLSFTGSPEVGWALKARAGKKKVVLELGGNAAVVVDETGNDLADVVERIVLAFYSQGGVHRGAAHPNEATMTSCATAWSPRRPSSWAIPGTSAPSSDR